jgi:hypothetical protein
VVVVVVVVVVMVDDEKLGTKFPVYLYPQIKTMRHITFDHVSGWATVARRVRGRLPISGAKFFVSFSLEPVITLFRETFDVLLGSL